jgi:hypothetical protein
MQEVTERKETGDGSFLQKKKKEEEPWTKFKVTPSSQGGFRV